VFNGSLGEVLVTLPIGVVGEYCPLSGRRSGIEEKDIDIHIPADNVNEMVPTDGE